MILSVDQLCAAAETTLKAAMPDIVATPAFQELLGENAEKYYDPALIQTWQQLPTIEAIATAKLPAVAITSPGLVDEPVYSRSSRLYEVKWRLAIGIYDRDKSTDHSATQARVRNWVAILRTALQSQPTLGGVATGLTWTGEEYSLLPNRNQARTAAAGAVSIDVKAQVPHHTNLGSISGTGGPLVLTTHPTLSVE